MSSLPGKGPVGRVIADLSRRIQRLEPRQTVGSLLRVDATGVSRTPLNGKSVAATPPFTAARWS